MLPLPIYTLGSGERQRAVKFLVYEETKTKPPTTVTIKAEVQCANHNTTAPAPPPPSPPLHYDLKDFQKFGVTS